MFDIVPHYIYKNYLSYYDDSIEIEEENPISLFVLPKEKILYSTNDIFVDTLFPDYSFKGYKYVIKSFNHIPENIINNLDLEIEVLSDN
jgi:hypothetical protein